MSSVESGPDGIGVGVHMVVPTHTPHHLDSCLAALARQTCMPRAVVVSCDTDDAAIGALLDRLWPRVVATLARRRQDDPTLGLPPCLIHVSRPHQGTARVNQVRNNALRTLDELLFVPDADLVLVVDGDTVLAPDAIERHMALAARRGAEVVIPFRVDLDQARTTRLSADALLDLASDPLHGLARPEEEHDLARRHARYERQLALRAAFGSLLVKSHKPKLLGGHHAVTVRRLRDVNGYDEQFEGYGWDDDDLARRLFRLRPPPRTAIAVRDIRAFHLWHPSRAPASPHQSEGFERFSRPGWTPRCARGWEHPLAQPQPEVRFVPPITRDAAAGASGQR